MDEEADYQDFVKHGRVTGDVEVDRNTRRLRSENQTLRSRAVTAEAAVAKNEEAYKQRLVDTRLRSEISATLGINPADETPEGKQRLALVDVLLPGARDLVKPTVVFGDNFEFTANFKPVVDLVKGSFGQAAATQTPSSGTSASITVPGIKPGSNGSAPSSPSMPVNHTHPASGAFVAALGPKR